MNQTRLPAPSKFLELGERGFGASTGYMEDARGRWPLLVSRAGALSQGAVELSALSGNELPGLVDFLEDVGSLDFDYVSVHGPARDWHKSAEDLAHALRHRIPDFVDAVVLHPETLSDLEPFGSLGSKLILENMDALKPTARTVEELAPYFEALPEAGFCFDVAHAQMVDPSMALAHGLLDAYGDRLREVHLSSIKPDGRHVPLERRDILSFLPVLDRCREVPWVFEAPFRS